MEKSSYGMAKFSLERKEPMPKRDCGFYIKYIFLFTSLIQFLIILGLVLFMVYGNAQGGTDTHLRVLEEQLQDRFNKITILASRNMNLTRTLNATLKEKQGLQVLAQKVQRELEKCNSTQAPNPVAKVRPGGGQRPTCGCWKELDLTAAPRGLAGMGGDGGGQSLMVMCAPLPAPGEFSALASWSQHPPFSPSPSSSSPAPSSSALPRGSKAMQRGPCVTP